MTSQTGKETGPVRLLSQASDQINRFSEVALFALMSLMITVTTLQVIFRFFFQALGWSEELTRFLLVLTSLVGTGIAFKRGTHIAVTAFVNRLPRLMKKTTALLVHLCGLFFFCVVVRYGTILMHGEASQTTPAMGISMSWIYAMYPLMGTVILIHLFDGLLKTWRNE